MKTPFLTSLKSVLSGKPAKGFVKNKKGVAATEFALLLPFLLGMTFLAFDTTAVMTQSKRSARHYYSLGDIIASSQNDLTCSTLDKIAELVYDSYRHSNWARRVRAGDDQFTERGAPDFRFILSVVEAVERPNGRIRGEVDWVFMRHTSQIQGNSGWRPGRRFNIPEGLQVPGTKFVRVHGQVYTKPLIGYLSDGSHTRRTIIRYFPLRFVNDVGLVEADGDPFDNRCSA